ncbi:DUF177 domain-containing protein [Jiella marina]|uniref:DUF177 domain-containing protein n=1 Tax=Jiella sp. LLJ827 TaxID=2917712 RepID=UPI002100CCC5|nr:DUF177 domain-containing protein [Jiella sp. LLJ827]MCQ0989206.1 DUF177 domain-containing protein [Jiella sp. LLJ827]
MAEEERPALRYPVQVAKLPKDGRPISFSAGRNVCDAVAAQLGILAIEQLSAELVARPYRKDGARVKGRIQARVSQESVVTFEPVEQVIDEPFEAAYVREAARPRRSDQDEGEIVIDPEADDPPETFTGDTIDLGERIVETVALALDLYPRRKGESFDRLTTDEAEDERPASAFDVLVELPVEKRREGE